MNTITQTKPSKTEIAQIWIKDSEQGMLTALSYVPDDKLHWSPAPTSRTPLQIAAHAAVVAGMIAERFAHPDEPSAPLDQILAVVQAETDKIKTRTQVEDRIRASANAVLDVLANMPDHVYEGVAQTPFGERPMARWVLIPSLHMDNHRAQIDYLQTIWGDTEMHFEPANN